MAKFSAFSTGAVLLAASALLAGGQTPGGRSRLRDSDWDSIRAAYERNRHAAVHIDGGYRARNFGQQWVTHFDGHGFLIEPDKADWRWGLAIGSYGRDGQQRSAGVSRVSSENQRVSYAWEGGLEEWFVNRPHGLEHGFTLNQRPAGTGGPLAIRLTVRGGLSPRAESGGRAATFVEADGRAVLLYGGLKVWDAAGNQLEARLKTEGNALRLEVDDRAARYPVTIDPIAQQAYLKASNTDGSDRFGWSVAVSGDTVVVGAPGEASSDTTQSDNSAAGAGAAYVFVRNGSTWSQQAYLKASNAQANDNFGLSVAISGDTIVVGAIGEASSAVGVDGDQADNSASFSGAAYVFVRNGTTWTQQAYLKASNTGAGDNFGQAVAIAGDTIVVGAPGEASNATNVGGDQGNNSLSGAGAAYVFRRGTPWSQEAYLKASNTGSNDQFGIAVAVSGNIVVVGANFEDSNATGINKSGADNSAFDSGAAYVFVRNGSSWSRQAYLKASNTGTGDEFGRSVAVSGTTILIGAPGEDSNATQVNGGQGNNAAEGAGAAYAFVRNSGGWSQQAYLKPTNAGAFDDFGFSVAIAGDTAIVGARGEDSSAAGVNGPQNNNNALNAGAAYVFGRRGSTWSQEDYLKASNPEAGDNFGQSVSTTTDTIVVSAFQEDGGSVGVGGNQSDNTAADAGAAYAFFSTCDQQVRLSLEPNVLEPDDHRMVEVTASLQIDRCVANVKVKLVSIKSNQADKGTGGGDLPNDIQQAQTGTDDRQFLLRAERGKAPDVIKSNEPVGRLYTVTYEVTGRGLRKTLVEGKVNVP